VKPCRLSAEQVWRWLGGAAGRRVGDHGGPTGEVLQRAPADQAGPAGCAGHRTHQRRLGQRSVRGGQHQVGEAATAQHRGVGEQQDVWEGGEQRRDLPAGEGQRPAVRDVDDVGAAGAQQPADLLDPLERRHVQRHHRALEQVRDHEVALAPGGAGAAPRGHPPSAVGSRPCRSCCAPARRGRDPPRRRAGGTTGGWPRCSAPGCSHPAEVHGTQRDRPAGVDDVPHQPHVVELQPGGSARST
jgi:hypothetical protein